MQVKNPPELVKSLAAGSPVVLLASKGRPGAVVLHVGDTWLLGALVANSQPPLWRAAPVTDDKPKAFPGAAADGGRAAVARFFRAGAGAAGRGTGCRRPWRGG